MGNARIRYVLVATLAAAMPLGCARQTYETPEPLHLHDVSYTQAMQTAEEVLGRLHFAISKRDLEQGLIRTEPVRGAQLFELWRSDNAGWFSQAEANLHTIRRLVELRVTREADRVSVACDVSVQRLSLPENEPASISQAYRMHSSSTAIIQRLELTPQQRQQMAWIDLGPDNLLAAKILKQIAASLDHSEEDEKT
ncbi:MAG: hypothetical protein A2Y77_03970 [Planctomycetes bacterium RBG_13_62_9]|nr:MAG: hypothetical protein A2Y77_03970 [Planctomycetes bacterium RBG_13_62_9]